jgi:ankyrin repeat protein
MSPNEFFGAVRAGSVERVREILKEHPWMVGAGNPGKDLWDERSPLHCAAKHGHLPVVRLVVDEGAEVYSNPMASYPPVIVAAGADIRAGDGQGRTALAAAIGNKPVRIPEVLLKHGAPA